MTPMRPIPLIITFIVTCLTSCMGRAETVFLPEAPSSKITPVEATKELAAGKQIYKCERVKAGPNINPVKVPGSSATWHTAVGTGLENPFERLASGQPTYRCALMEANQANGRVRKAI